MKILTQLTANASERDLPETRGSITAVHDEPVPGFFRQLRLTGTALVISRRDRAIAIPLPELFALAELHEPALTPPAPHSTLRTPQS